MTHWGRGAFRAAIGYRLGEFVAAMIILAIILASVIIGSLAIAIITSR